MNDQPLLHAENIKLRARLALAVDDLKHIVEVDKFGGINQYDDIWVIAERALARIETKPVAVVEQFCINDDPELGWSTWEEYCSSWPHTNKGTLIVWPKHGVDERSES